MFCIQLFLIFYFTSCIGAFNIQVLRNLDPFSLLTPHFTCSFCLQSRPPIRGRCGFGVALVALGLVASSRWLMVQIARWRGGCGWDLV
ncbi:hypothetical protein B0T10DRAFT_138574 [Thelonectria olida]|uniref:Secreted protein n=1 Tax=Thelonectria olida TaxID=1576542 RepID=A0A9P9ANR5_9HYPO|nr:hypothetical protein B0T10DRAFT_138574 [Thelonectria olida]